MSWVYDIGNIMNSEKIAFLFPFKGETGEDKIPPPLLAFDCEVFPTDIDMNAGVFFIGLHREKPYYLEVQIFRVAEPEDVPVSVKRGIWIRSKDSLGKENDIAASIDLTISKCRFDEPGSYFINASLLSDQQSIHTNRAYFRVSQEA